MEVPMRLFSFLGVILFALSISCSDERAVSVEAKQGPADDVGYKPGEDDVVIADATTWVVSGASAADCVTIGTECLQIQTIKEEQCGDPNAQVDIIWIDGKATEVVCYPPPSQGVTVEEVIVSSDGQSEIPQNSPNKVVTFPESSDGVPIKEDLTLNAEQIVIIGNGVDKTILDGNVTIASNNSKLRGLTINGNVTFEQNSNNSVLSFCKIKGNLVVNSNDVTIFNCEIFGNVEINGNNSLLLNMGVGGELKIEGNTSLCENNYSFSDPNSDFIIAESEKGAPLDCSALAKP